MGVALGAHAQTFAGLSGMGDLVLTCSAMRRATAGLVSRSAAAGRCPTSSVR
jgi:glycerol-3-phosphate dehydrogenase